MRSRYFLYFIPCVFGFMQTSCVNIEASASDANQSKQKTTLSSRLDNAFWVYDDPITRHSIVFELDEHSHNKGYYLYREWKYDCNRPEQPVYRMSGIPSSEDNGIFVEFYIPSHHLGYKSFLNKILSDRLHMVEFKPKKKVVLLKQTMQNPEHYTFYYQKDNKARCRF